MRNSRGGGVSDCQRDSYYSAIDPRTQKEARKWWAKQEMKHCFDCVEQKSASFCVRSAFAVLYTKRKLKKRNAFRSQKAQDPPPPPNTTILFSFFTCHSTLDLFHLLWVFFTMSSMAYPRHHQPVCRLLASLFFFFSFRIVQPPQCLRRSSFPFSLIVYE